LSRASRLLRRLPSLPTRRSSDLVLPAAACRDQRDRDNEQTTQHELVIGVCASPDNPPSRSRRSSDRARPAPPTSPRTRRCTAATDRKSTRLNSSHVSISYAVFCL